MRSRRAPAKTKWSISQLMTRFQIRKRVPCFGTPKHAFEYESMAPIIQTWSLFVNRTTKEAQIGCLRSGNVMNGSYYADRQAVIG